MNTSHAHERSIQPLIQSHFTGRKEFLACLALALTLNGVLVVGAVISAESIRPDPEITQGVISVYSVDPDSLKASSKEPPDHREGVPAAPISRLIQQYEGDVGRDVKRAA